MIVFHLSISIHLLVSIVVCKTIRKFVGGGLRQWAWPLFNGGLCELWHISGRAGCLCAS